MVDIECPANMTIMANPGSASARVNWPEPDLTGLKRLTNFTSSASPGGTFPIGVQEVTYHQYFGVNDLSLECSFFVEIIGECFMI